MKSPFYVQVTGSYDAVFVGPFETMQGALNYQHGEQYVKPQFDYVVMDSEAKAISESKYGKLPIQAPAYYTE